ncbi:hypothetical protein JOB18_041509 [Solea senegalensis]|uniref:Secreted protein n=1 Tax=Solea senegalensis TaxID=28829 RepID=A0AAV6SIV2_SOLSE|nr:hypothetical protein JOB18_041509 [Solea senegalensis]
MGPKRKVEQQTLKFRLSVALLWFLAAFVTRLDGSLVVLIFEVITSGTFGIKLLLDVSHSVRSADLTEGSSRSAQSCNIKSGTEPTKQLSHYNTTPGRILS